MTVATPLPHLTGENVALAPRTTLGVGGPARYVCAADNEAALRAIVCAATERRLPLLVLGGGSNVLIGDEGFDGVVLELTNADATQRRDGDWVYVSAGAGLEWDELVAWCCYEGWAGIECLSGIPGRVGAAPIQNIGAYGQEVAEVVERVRVFDRQTFEVRDFSSASCEFSYRNSAFKSRWRDRFIVLEVELRMRRGGSGALKYDQVRQLFEGDDTPAPLAVRDAVLGIRRSKSMVYDTKDPNHRSAGSFFTNPIVAQDVAAAIRAKVRVELDEELPQYGAGDGRTKLSAAWLIEHSGYRRGYARGNVGLSSKHALAVINRGGATASDIALLCADIQQAVIDRWGVGLEPEPVFVGVATAPRHGAEAGR